MAKELICPYHHPTQALLIDDDIDFLGNLSLQLDADLAYLLFDSTEKALHYIHNHSTRHPIRDHFFHLQDTEAQDGNGTLRINEWAVRNQMRSSARFNQISVVLVDYAMPRMNGLEFCQRIDNPNIKKVLFTGVATEYLAVDAFNEGVIDRYIRKQETAVYQTLNQTIRRLQKDYIQDLFRAADEIVSVEKPDFLAIPAVRAILDEALQASDGVEYYYVSEPPGFLIATSAGTMYRLLIQTRAQAGEDVRVAGQAGVDPDTLAAIDQGELVPHPLLGHSRYTPARLTNERQGAGNEPLSWQLFDITEEQANEWAVHPTYDEFLEWLDSIGYSMM